MLSRLCYLSRLIPRTEVDLWVKTQKRVKKHKFQLAMLKEQAITYVQTSKTAGPELFRGISLEK